MACVVFFGAVLTATGTGTHQLFHFSSVASRTSSTLPTKCKSSPARGWLKSIRTISSVISRTIPSRRCPSAVIMGTILSTAMFSVSNLPSTSNIDLGNSATRSSSYSPYAVLQGSTNRRNHLPANFFNFDSKDSSIIPVPKTNVRGISSVAFSINSEPVRLRRRRKGRTMLLQIYCLLFS